MNTAIKKHAWGRKVLILALTAVMVLGVFPFTAPLTAYAAGTASIDQVEISGNIGLPLRSGSGATIRLSGDTVSVGNLNQTDVTGWFSNLPAGISAKVLNVINQNIIVILFEGTPSALSSALLNVTIPGSVLTSNTSIAVSQSSSARFAILPPPTAAVDNVTISGMQGAALSVQTATITLTNATHSGGFSDIPISGVGGWVTGLPAGVTASASTVVNNADKIFITFTGTPTAVSTMEFPTITIPEDRLNCTTALTVTANPNAKFNIIAPAAPTITSISPTSGFTTGGTSVTLTGTNLFGTTSVTVGGTNAAFNNVSGTGITFTTPVGSVGAANVVVTTPNGSATLTGGFTYIAPPSNISVNDTGFYATRTDIETAIGNALNSGDVATVTGTLSGVTDYLWLTIPAGKTVLWQADYSSSNYFRVVGSGTLEIANGGKITSSDGSQTLWTPSTSTASILVGAGGVVENTGSGRAINTSGNSTIIVNGGTVSASTSAIYAYDTSVASVIITGGTITPTVNGISKISGNSTSSYYIGDRAGLFDSRFTPGTDLFALDGAPALTANGGSYTYSSTPSVDPVVATLSDKLNLTDATVTASVGNPAIDKSARTVTFGAGVNNTAITITVTGAKITGTNTAVSFTTAAFGVNVFSPKADVSDKISFAPGSATYTGSELDCAAATISGIAAGANPGWTYNYVAGGGNASLGASNKPLTAGTYTATAIYEDDNNRGEASGTFTVDKASQSVPGAPTSSGKTAESVTLSGTTTALEYAYNTTGTNPSSWSACTDTTTVISGLTPNTTYYFYLRLAETANLNASPASAAQTITTDKAVLGGTVTISGTEKYGETLTVNTGGLTTDVASYTDFGTLTYHWLRGNTTDGFTTIDGEISSSYTLTAADIGLEIRAQVYSDNCLGAVTSGSTGTIGKATSAVPPAPTVNGAPTEDSITLNAITGAEYRLSTAVNGWQASPTFTGLAPNTGYTFYARLAETNTHLASPDSAISASITTSKLSQSAPGAPTEASKGATSVTLTPPTVGSGALEYQKNGDGTAWQSSATFINLDPNTAYTFYARLAGDATHEPSDASPGVSITTDKAALTGTLTISGTEKYGETLTAQTGSLTSTPSGDLGTLSYQWKRGGTNITVNGTGATYQIAEADIGQTITVTVTAANAMGEVTSGATGAITKADGPVAPASVTGSYTGNGTTFTYKVAAISGAEYSKDGINWQDSNEFAGFTTSSPATTFYARIKETTNVNTGAAGNTGAVTFALLSDRSAPALNYSVSGSFPNKTVTITPVSGAEYSFDGGATYTSTNTYSSASAESFNLAIRLTATATHNASPASTGTVNTANQIQNPPPGGGSTPPGSGGNTGGTTGNTEGTTGNTGGSGGDGTKTEIDEPAEPKDNAPIVDPSGNEIEDQYIYTPEDIAGGKATDIPADQSFFVAAPKGSLSWDKSQLDGYYDAAAGGYIFTPLADAGNNVEITYTDKDGNETTLSFTITDAATPLGAGDKDTSGFPWWIIAIVVVVIAALLWWVISRKRRNDNNEKAA
jgi:hypothetical protein